MVIATSVNIVEYKLSFTSKSSAYNAMFARQTENSHQCHLWETSKWLKATLPLASVQHGGHFQAGIHTWKPSR